MSAEILRRAAVALRQHAEAATPGPWISCPQSADGQNFVVTGKDAVPAFGLEVCSHDGDHNVDLRRQQVDADLIALLGPPVALALADLLHVLSWFPSQADPTDMKVAEVLARAILREPEAGDEG